MRAKLDKVLRLHWVHWAVIVLSGTVTLTAWWIARNQLAEKNQDRFDREAESAVDLVMERMQKYENALWGGAGMLHTHEGSVSPKQWQWFAKTMTLEVKYPGINGIGIIYYLTPDQVPGFLEAQRRTRPDFRIHPAHDKQEFWPITNIEPVETNKQAVGLDMAHESNRLQAAKKARDTETAQITGPIVLVQDKEKTPGFLFYVPFYKNHLPDDPTDTREFKGLVYAPFVVNKLMQGVLAYERRHVGIKIIDDEQVIYNELDSKTLDIDHEPMFTRRDSLMLYGRQWTFEIHSTQSFREAFDSDKPSIILLVGLLVDALLLLLFLVLSRSNTQLAAEVEQRKNAEASLQKVHEELEVRVVSRTEQLRSSQAKLALIIEKSSNGVLIVNADDEIIMANPWCDRHFGYKRDELLHQPLTTIFSEDELPRAKAAGTREIHGIHKTGHLAPMKVVSDSLTLDGQPATLLTLTDISSHKAVEEAMKQANDNLIRSNKELEQFAYVASHDLQEPLRKISTFCTLLEEEYGEQLGEDGRLYIHYAVDGAQRMRQLIQDMLTYAKAQNQEHNLTQVNIHEVLQTALDNLSVAIKINQAEISHDDLPCLHTDASQLTQLFQNLISNGIKYRRAEIAPKIHVGVKKSDKMWVFSVTDNGIGIAPQYHKQVFGIFKRLHTRETYQGTGIGLALCQSIVTRLRGHLWVESSEGEGSTFYFSLPRTPSTDTDGFARILP